MSVDPFPSYTDVIGSPYVNAIGISRAEIEAGDIELPFVSSAICVQGPCLAVSRLKVTLQGGAIVTFRTVGCQTLEVRAVMIHQEVDDGEFLAPDSVVALW